MQPSSGSRCAQQGRVSQPRACRLAVQRHHLLPTAPLGVGAAVARRRRCSQRHLHDQVPMRHRTSSGTRVPSHPWWACTPPAPQPPRADVHPTPGGARQQDALGHRRRTRDSPSPCEVSEINARVEAPGVMERRHDVAAEPAPGRPRSRLLARCHGSDARRSGAEHGCNAGAIGSDRRQRDCPITCGAKPRPACHQTPAE
jgi:hypothetical protein